MVSALLKVLLPLLLHTSHLVSGYGGGYTTGGRYPKEEEIDYLEGIDVSSMLTVVTSTPKTVTVKVKQSLIGDPNDCEGSAKATFFFMVFKHGRTGEDICPFYRHVDACFERTITLHCDPTTNRANIDVYNILDHSGTIHRYATVDNPFVGKCFPNRSILEASAKYSALLACGQAVEGKPESCADVLALSPDAKDGEYVIWHKDQSGNGNGNGGDEDYVRLNLYCHNMNGPGAPKEYLSLLYKKGNFADRNTENQFIRTFYDKIRMDPVTLKVDIADPTFSVTYYQVDGHSFVPYGTAINTSSERVRSMSKIDLRDTIFKIADVDDLSFVGGWVKGGVILRPRDNDQTMTMFCSDYEGWVNPGPALDDAVNAPLGSFNLQLAVM